ncbi:MAG: hypothetical protein ACRDTE_30555, partial [Pseudonocardiaceae bacterium]
LGTVSGSATTQPGPSASAYGIAATGAVPVSPAPQAISPPEADGALLEVPQPLGLGALTVSVADYSSSAKAADLDLINGAVTADVIETTCDNGVGAVSILNGNVAGSALPSSPGIGENVDGGLISLVANRQTTNGDGTLTVDGLVISLLPGGDPTALVGPRELSQFQSIASALGIASPREATDVQDLFGQLQELNPNMDIPLAGSALQEIVISSATCSTAPVPDEPVVPGQDDVPADAPQPETVETRLPVTH